MSNEIVQAFNDMFKIADNQDRPDIRNMFEFEGTNRGNAKRWFSERINSKIHTLQIKINERNKVVNVWVPGERNIDRVNSVSVVLDGSHREFQGLKTIHESNHMLVCWTEFGTHKQAMIFKIEE